MSVVWKKSVPGGSPVRLWQLLRTDSSLPLWLTSHIEALPCHITRVNQSETLFSSELNPNQAVVWYKPAPGESWVLACGGSVSWRQGSASPASPALGETEWGGRGKGVTWELPGGNMGGRSYWGEEYVTSEPPRRSGGALEGQGLRETVSSTQSKGWPEIKHQRKRTEEGESKHLLTSFQGFKCRI